jgi:hypothetical protein
LFKSFKAILGTALGKLLAAFNITYILDRLIPDNMMGQGSTKKKVAALGAAIFEMLTFGFFGPDTTSKVMQSIDNFLSDIMGTFEEWANSDSSIVAFFGELFGLITLAFEPFIGILIDGLAYFGKMVAYVWEKPEEAWQNVKDSMEFIVPWFKDLGRQVIEGFMNSWQDLGPWMKQGMSDAWEAAKSVFSGSPVDSPKGKGGVLGTGIMDGLLGSIKNAFGSVTDTFGSVWNLATEGAAEAFQSIANAIMEIVNAFNQMPARVMTDFGITMDSVLGAAGKIKNADAPIKIIKEATKYQKEVAANKDNVDALAEILKSTSGDKSGGGNTTIRLELDGRVLKEFVLGAQREGLSGGAY